MENVAVHSQEKSVLASGPTELSGVLEAVSLLYLNSA